MVGEGLKEVWLHGGSYRRRGRMVGRGYRRRGCMVGEGLKES